MATRRAQGDISVRKALADHINSKYGTDITADNFYLTAGAAASFLCAAGHWLFPEMNFWLFAPYFPEYKVYVESAGAVLSAIPATDNFQADLEKFEKL